MRRIVCAAIKDQSGHLVCGPRHMDITMHHQITQMMSFSPPWEQGFVDQNGVFLNREEAYIVAKEANQIIRRVGGDEVRLYSENLY